MRRRADATSFGALPGEGGVHFGLWAPDVETVALELVDPRSGEPLSATPMTPAGDGWHEHSSAEAAAGSLYRFRLPDGTAVPDPASRFQPRGVHGPSEVIDPQAWQWRHPGWRGRPWHEAVIYELHVGTFTPEGTFAAARARLPFLAELGVTAIELMPVGAFPGERGWGYDGVLPYAPHHAYGRPEDLKALVDAAHEAGLMVLLDVIYNHFGPDGNYLSLYAGRFFRDDRPTPWGPAIDYRQRPVRDFAIDNALYWLEEYRFDGLRLDAVHAITDEDEPHLLEELASTVRERLGEDRHVHLVLENEHNEARRLVRDRAGRAPHYDAQWNDDWHHCVHVLLTGEQEGYYGAFGQPAKRLARALAEGFVYQGEPFAPRDGEPRGEPSAELPPLAFVPFLQNHDQIGNRALGERLASLAPAHNVRVALAMLLLVPSVPMLFMGEEWGSRRPFLFFTGFEGELADMVREGRRREFSQFSAFSDPGQRERIPDPNALGTFRASTLDWSEHEGDEEAETLAMVRRLLELRREELMPRLEGITGDCGWARALQRQAVAATWRLGDGSRLSLLVNLGPEPLEKVVCPMGDCLFELPSGTHEVIQGGRMEGWSIAWFLDDGSGRT
ncbi:malto-oligosyltrehalose trehalohydrolase [Marinimicrococcus flavescens]|uniref:Malto-oligosyltrehalose trehalohydrolase n=1 Tax=Marinimicrococcus flavescens TaxID=3031815 RepID=A0AAP3UZU0_9PROT|nr:malto-oligosyltrehalose trehalohydrolase [Marinimicrococcus flavescens]